MKHLITITIDAPSRNDVGESEKMILKAFEETRTHINNGSKIRFSSTNASNGAEMMRLFGQLKWWSLARQDQKEPVRKGFWTKLGEEIRSMYEEAP